MKNEKKNLLRIQSMIEKDRICAGENFMQLIENDLNRLLRDYFDFVNPLEIKIERQNNGYYFTLNLNVSRIKNFANTTNETFDNL